jgi:ATP-binding cassette subfamily A (ABC1) protein 3
VPLRTEQIDLVDTGAISGLKNNLPFFLIFIYLIPVYYITTKLTEEKESKAREGMKMMGLKDATYYLAWIILNTLIVLVISIIVTILQHIVLNNCSFLLIFFLNFFYGLSFLGSILFCSAVLPSARKASIAVGLLNFLGFFMSTILRDESPEASL